MKGDPIMTAILDSVSDATGFVYWHRELPPADAEAVSEHVIEAASRRIPGTIVHRDELWGQVYEDLKCNAAARLRQELARMGGDYVHVLDETIESRHDYKTGESWLHGRFTYVMYRRARS